MVKNNDILKKLLKWAGINSKENKEERKKKKRKKERMIPWKSTFDDNTLVSSKRSQWDKSIDTKECHQQWLEWITLVVKHKFQWRKKRKKRMNEWMNEWNLKDIMKLWWWHPWYHKKDFDKTSSKTPRKVTNNGPSGPHALSRHHHRSPLQLPLVIFLDVVEIVLSRSFCWYWGCHH